MGFNRDDPGRLYRALRSLENDGLVRSLWEKSGSGPDRRTYELTPAGTQSLHESAQALAATNELLVLFLSRHSDFVTGDPSAAGARAARPGGPGAHTPAPPAAQPDA